MAGGALCLVTIHGIGFQQAPTDGTPGYADGLHERLSAILGPTLLSDDPNRTRTRPGQNGAIYVQSSWPPRSNAHEPGLARLGRWAVRQARVVDTTGAPLVAGDARIAHVALVYSDLEEPGPHVGAALVAAAMAATSFSRYTSAPRFAAMLGTDIRTMLAHRQPPTPEPVPASLRVRQDTPPGPPRVVPPPLPQRPPSPFEPSGLVMTLRALQDDMATYVARNDLRERVRGFVREALLRLASREDVEGIVVNAHSNGTVLAYDVLRALPPFIALKVRWLVTMGSPLRKYAAFFRWGTEAAGIRQVTGWTNFWDPRDPVADPLAPPAAWQPGDPIPPPAGRLGLFRALNEDTGAMMPIVIDDRAVDNVRDSAGGGLQAHNYWDNGRDVVGPLAGILKRVLPPA
jgi:hypothetical protein